MSGCVANSHYLGDPEVFKSVFRVFLCIGVPIHLYGAWCILFKTSSSMLPVKKLLLWNHFLGVLMDLSISITFIPYLLTHTFAIYALGVVDNTEIQVFIIFVIIAMDVMSIVSIFENRYHILFGKNNNPWWCEMRKYFLSANYMSTVFFVLPMAFTIPDQSIGLQKVQEQIPCIPESSIYGRHIFVCAFDLRLAMVSLGYQSFLLLFETITFLIIIIKKLFHRKKSSTAKVSNRTQILQKKFALALIIQTSVPICCLMVPVIYFLSALIFNYDDQNLTNLSVITGATHGMWSSIVMIAVHQPYREATKNLFCRSSQRDSSKMVSCAAVGLNPT